MPTLIPPWITEAKKFIGLREFPGKQHNPTILKWWAAIKAPFTDDETPWCAGFVGGILESVGIKSSRSAMARSYQHWGVPLTKPRVGCIVTFWRGSKNGSSGHVGFFDGFDQYGNLMIIGGNQGDKVSRVPFKKDRVLGYRWPTGYDTTTAITTVTHSDGKVSTNEA